MVLHHTAQIYLLTRVQANEKEKEMQMNTQISESAKQDPEDFKFFRTTDIDLAAALKSAGAKLEDMGLKLERSKGRSFKRTEYSFDAEGTKELIMKYMNNDLQVDARTLLQERESFKKQRFNKGAR